MVSQVTLRFALLCSVVLGAGCSLLTSFADLTDGNEPLSPKDASLDSREREGQLDGDVNGNVDVDGDADVHVDAATEDASELNEDASVSDPDAGSDASTPIITKQTFFDGFERTALLGDWSSQTGSLGTLLLSTNVPKTGSKILRSQIPVSEGAPKNLERLLGPVQKAELSFAIRIAAPSARTVRFGGLRYSHSGGARETSLFLAIDGSKVALVEEEMPGSHYIKHGERNFSFNHWVDVVAEIDQTKSPQTVKLWFNTEVMFDGELERDFSPATATLIAACSHATAGPATDVDVDDIRIEWLPF